MIFFRRSLVPYCSCRVRVLCAYPALLVVAVCPSRIPYGRRVSMMFHLEHAALQSIASRAAAYCHNCARFSRLGNTSISCCLITIRHTQRRLMRSAQPQHPAPCFARCPNHCLVLTQCSDLYSHFPLSDGEDVQAENPSHRRALETGRLRLLVRRALSQSVSLSLSSSTLQ